MTLHSYFNVNRTSEGSAKITQDCFIKQGLSKPAPYFTALNRSITIQQQLIQFTVTDYDHRVF
jgi:hypothetical protein